MSAWNTPSVQVLPGCWWQEAQFICATVVPEVNAAL